MQKTKIFLQENYNHHLQFLKAYSRENNQAKYQELEGKMAMILSKIMNIELKVPIDGKRPVSELVNYFGMKTTQGF